MSVQTQKHLAVLSSRRDYLWNRIRADPNHASVKYSRDEIAALDGALKELKDRAYKELPGPSGPAEGFERKTGRAFK